jgi:hypothetical protein
MESVKTRASGHSRLSDIGLLKYRAHRRTDKAMLGASSRLRRVVARDFWQQAIPRSKSFFLEAFDDLKSIVDWRHSAWRLYTLLFPLLFVAGVASILPLVSSRRLYRVSDACQPDSGFYVGYQEYDIWDLSGFFQITLGFGEFSFSMAKTIDVGWDVSGFDLVIELALTITDHRRPRWSGAPCCRLLCRLLKSLGTVYGVVSSIVWYLRSGYFTERLTHCQLQASKGSVQEQDYTIEGCCCVDRHQRSFRTRFPNHTKRHEWIFGKYRIFCGS